LVLRFGALGPLEVTDSDGRELGLGGHRQRSVLAILLLHAGAVLSNERLVDELWGERPPASARKTVQTYVLRLRKALGDNVLITRPGGYTLRLQGAEFDVDRFESLLAGGRDAIAADHPGRAAELLGEALGLWRGAPYADLAYEAFAEGEIARLTESRMAALEDRIDADLALGRHAALIGELDALVREHPLRERMCAQLMLALYRGGRQAEALDAYQRAREHLTGQLGLEPGAELRSLQEAILRQDPALSESSLPRAGAPRASVSAHLERAASLVDPGRSQIPRGVRVIGRDRELVELAQLLADPEVALVTLTGTGGIGKTTLALEAARAALSSFADGGQVVWLASIVSEQQVLTELARALEIELSGREPAIVGITRVLRSQHLLLVLDNFEHVVEAAPAIAQLAATCPRLKLLVTSRTPLRIAPERSYAVPALTVAGPDDGGPVQDVGTSPAEALFIDRATAADPSLSLTAQDGAAVRELCRYLGGLPLAVELAAARTAVLSPSAILERLRAAGEPMGPARRDAPARQRTLEATIDWSYELIAPGERAVFTRLAVFHAGFTVESAEAVCGDLDVPIADALAGLLDHGLIHRAPAAARGGRLGMLEPIRRYALDRLRADPSYDDVLARRGKHFAAFAAAAEAGLLGRHQPEWLDHVDDEQANLRAVLQGATSARQVENALRIAGALTRYWHVRDLSRELVEWLTPALAGPRGDTAVRAQGLYTLGRTALYIGERQTATRALDECLALAERLGNPRLAALAESLIALALLHRREVAQAAVHRERALAWLASVADAATRAYVLMNVAVCPEDGEEDSPARPADERALMLEAVALYESAGDLLGLPYARSNLGWSAWLAGDLELARTNLERALVEAEAISVNGLRAIVAANLGLVELVEGRDNVARAHLVPAITVLTQIGQVRCAREAMIGLAALSVREGAFDDCSRLLDAAARLHDGPLGKGETMLYERYLEPAGAFPRNAIALIG
jgi:predicted ATPase/DNA-binding SARP family transcriptional activator